VNETKKGAKKHIDMNAASGIGPIVGRRSSSEGPGIAMVSEDRDLMALFSGGGEWLLFAIQVAK
jgi:hypothetical protein